MIDVARRPSAGVQSVERSLDLLDSIAFFGGQASLAELSQATGLPAGTIHRLLQTMIGRGYVRQGTTRRYHLGAALILLGDQAGGALASTAQPYLQELVAVSGETANLAMLSGGKVVYVAQAHSKHLLRVTSEAGQQAPLHCSAVGKVLLASRRPQEVQELLDRTGLPSKTTRTLTDRSSLLLELDRVKIQGYGLDSGEGEEGVRCMAVPVIVGSHCVAAVSISGPQGRFEPQGDEGLLENMRLVAAKLAQALARSETQEHQV